MSKKKEAAIQAAERRLLLTLDNRMDEIIEKATDEVRKNVMQMFSNNLDERVERSVMTKIGELIAGRIEVQTKFIKLDE